MSVVHFGMRFVSIINKLDNDVCSGCDSLLLKVASPAQFVVFSIRCFIITPYIYYYLSKKIKKKSKVAVSQSVLFSSFPRTQSSHDDFSSMTMTNIYRNWIVLSQFHLNV